MVPAADLDAVNSQRDELQAKLQVSLLLFFEAPIPVFGELNILK